MSVMSAIGGLNPFLSNAGDGFLNPTPVTATGGSTGASATAAAAPSQAPGSVAAQQAAMGITPLPAPPAGSSAANSGGIVGQLGMNGAGTNAIMSLLQGLTGGGGAAVPADLMGLL